ncbi:hypothetical protein [Bacillus sp. JCM 19041]|uniref:MGH1-like glycoside hydrolase domain-containing protein n=1 Tax=Bacillus sp. JCM 19041 TaxID=1460637 RepID=UPI0006CF390B
MSHPLLSRLYKRMSIYTKAPVHFVSTNRKLEKMATLAFSQLNDCLEENEDGRHVLLEGGIYRGTWLESTGTINAEIVSRFFPDVAEATFELFAKHQRNDGLMPYKWTTAGPAYRQIQLVSPLARSVWNHYLLNGRNKDFLQRMYSAMSGYDKWLASNRDTRKTGCVEAFSTFDTGHDSSPRFWHAPDVPHREDASLCHPDSPILPFLAPDLTANVYCQRTYLSLVADELGVKENNWIKLANNSLTSLMNHCFDQDDLFFYDRDKNGQLVKIQSDVLLRVLACEIGDDAFFQQALRRYLLNTSKFFSKYPFPSIALDDPRFDSTSIHDNSWGGATNFLSLIRAPHAFDYHGHHVEFTWVMHQILTVFSHSNKFPQTINPWTGEAGFTEVYSPSILCLLDFIERLSGILPRPNGDIWATGLVPYPYQHSDDICETAYSRHVNGKSYELLNTLNTCILYQTAKKSLVFQQVFD